MFSMYKGKTVLVTGHTGFKGSWLAVWLNQLGAKVVGLSDRVPTSPSHFIESGIVNFITDYRIDICDSEAVREIILNEQPDYVFHLAAQALVRPSYVDPLLTMKVNSIGTANILDALRFIEKPVTALMITSDKAYDNVEWVWGYRETDAVGGKDPYSASKGMAELVIRSYVESFFRDDLCDIKIGIARAGNVIGGGDWALDRIVPDCMNAWADGGSVDIRSPYATRPWQHVLEPLSGYLLLGVELTNNPQLHGEAYNFGPAAHSNHCVAELIEEMKQYWESVSWNDVSDGAGVVHEAGLLKLNCDKALLSLSWHSALEFKQTVKMTVSWYKEYYSSNPLMLGVSEEQIRDYTLAAKYKGLQWAQ